MRQDLYDAHSQGETVGTRYTANLGYVRELPAAGCDAGYVILSSGR